MKKYFISNLTRTISLSFVMVIILGTILLSLPICNQQESAGFINNLFVATSATCVTGLVPVVVANQYSIVGQLVILGMIQIGGLGFLTFLMLFFVLLKKKLSFSSRLLMSEVTNQSNLDTNKDFIKYIFKYTLVVECIGAICLFMIFIQDYRFIDALYYSVFHSVSAFCNAGFDVLGNSSLMNYNQHPWLLFVISMLIILGGIGFLVAKEIQNQWKLYLNNPGPLIKYMRGFSLHTKLVMMMTSSLIICGGILVFLMEKNNPLTIGKMPLIHQITNSLFQSITYRTAGFASFDQGALTESSKLIACLLMFIGGSPAGCAGGIKTVTVAVLFLSVQSTVKGRKDIVAFNRSIKRDEVMRAISVICISLSIVFLASIVLCMIEPFSMIDLLFEVFSAFATVGLTCSISPSLSVIGKLIVIILMYIGRIGPISMVLTLMRKTQTNKENDIKYPNGDILVG